MRKIFATFALLVFSSVTIFAGETPLGGGRSCPDPEPGQATTECGNPPSQSNNQSSTSSTETGSTGTEESGILDDVIDYLNSLFG